MTMPITTQWDDPTTKLVIRYDLSGKWTWEEFWQAYLDAELLMDGADHTHTVHYILNSTDDISARHVPSGVFSQLPRFYKSSKGSPNGRTVRVPTPTESLYRMWDSVATKIFPRIAQRITFAKSLDDARDMIQSWHDEEQQASADPKAKTTADEA